MQKLVDADACPVIETVEKIAKEDNIELYNIMHAINIKDKSKRYSFIYDTVCDYIDKKYLECNYCDFKDDICVFFRNHPKIMHKNLITDRKKG